MGEGNRKTIIVLAGGKSAKEHDIQNLKQQGFVIGVNDSARHAPVNCAVTMDRTWFLNRWQLMKELNIPIYARREAVVNVEERWEHLHIFDCNREAYHMTEKQGHLDGLNSGFCALNLAFQMKPERVVPLGFDCAPTGYWYAAYEWQPHRGVTSEWAYKRWQKGIDIIKGQFDAAGIQWG